MLGSYITPPLYHRLFKTNRKAATEEVKDVGAEEIYALAEAFPLVFPLAFPPAEEVMAKRILP